MIIICYDGSEQARAAADWATRLFHGTPATVVTVWGPGAGTLASAELGLGSGFGVGYHRTNDAAHLDGMLHERARRTAEEGTRYVRAAGMVADPLVERRSGSVARTVLAVAARINAEAVVVGTLRHAAGTSTLLGSVSHDLVRHADRPVAVVPFLPEARRQGAAVARASTGNGTTGP